MNNNKKRIKILLVYSTKDTNNDFVDVPEKVEDYLIEERYCLLENLRFEAYRWNPQVIIFSAKIRPNQIDSFGEENNLRTFFKKPYFISFFWLPKGTSRELRKIYKKHIREFQRSTLSFTKFLKTIT